MSLEQRRAQYVGKHVQLFVQFKHHASMLGYTPQETVTTPGGFMYIVRAAKGLCTGITDSGILIGNLHRPLPLCDIVHIKLVLTQKGIKRLQCWQHNGFPKRPQFEKLPRRLTVAI